MHVLLTRLGTLERFHLHRWSPCTCILQTLGFLTGWTSHRNIENPPNNPKLQLQVADESAGSLTLDHVCTLYSSHCHWALVVCESLVDQQQTGFTVEFFHKIKLYILQRSKVSSWACWICPQIETGPLFLPGFVLADDSNTRETESLICELAPILLDSSCSAKCWFRIIRSLRILTRCKLGVRENTTQIKRLSREQPHTRSTRFTEFATGFACRKEFWCLCFATGFACCEDINGCFCAFANLDWFSKQIYNLRLDLPFVVAGWWGTKKEGEEERLQKKLTPVKT